MMDNTLKTQIRWGDHDIEVYTKVKGSETQYKKVDLKDFMGTEELPDYDLSIRWTLRKDTRPRRKLQFRKDGPHPSILGECWTQRPTRTSND